MTAATVTHSLSVFLIPALWKAFTALVQELILHHHQHKGPPKGTDEGRKPAPSGPQKGGGGRKRQPPTTKARGVILPLHLRVSHIHCCHTGKAQYMLYTEGYIAYLYISPCRDESMRRRREGGPPSLLLPPPTGQRKRSLSG